MTTTAKTPPTREQGGEGELRHYTPEEVYEKGLLPYKPRTLRDMAQKHQIPHSRQKGPRGAIYFRLAQIRRIAKSLEVEPISEIKAAQSRQVARAA